MARFSVDALNHQIADNRNRLAQLASAAGQDNPLMQRVLKQLELSIAILERLRDEMLTNKARGT
jgi:hypothetical protein